MINPILYFQTAIEHEALAAAGKKYLHSRRRIATEKLSQRANFQPGRLSAFIYRS